MKKCNKKYISWLQDKIRLLIPYSEMIFIFGSIANNSINPSDCDLFIVSNFSSNNSEWKKLRAEIKKLNKLFFFEFKLELNSILTTKNEFSENLPILNRIKKRKKIILYKG